MRRQILSASLSAVAIALVGAVSSVARAETPAAIVADPARPKADTDLDGARKPADVLAFLGLKRGDKVIDVFAGPYFDRLFSKAVGPDGNVYMFIPAEIVKAKEAPELANGSKPFPSYPNIIALTAPIADFKAPAPVDLVWIRQNYHDLYDPFMGPADVAKFNKAVFDALKPGGLYIVVDHAAPAGSGLADTNTTHRIDPAVVKKDMAAAGFKFVSESDLFKNPADPHDKLVFDPSIRGHTDQFMFKFRKPG